MNTTTEENYISLAQASKIFRLKDPEFRSLERLFEEGLTKYKHTGFVMFSETELAKHVGLENLQEPFLSLSEAADLLKVASSVIMSLVKKKLLPSYSLHSTKGSKLFFLKGELEHSKKGFSDTILIKDGIYWDQEVRMEMFQISFKGMTRWLEEDLEINPRDVEIAQAYMCNNESLSSIAEKFGLTKERCRQINEKVYRRLNRINSIAERFYANKKALILDNRELRGENIRLKSELSKLSANSKPEEVLDKSKDAFLAIPLEELGLPTLCFNALKSACIRNLGEIIDYSILDIMKFRTFGPKSARQLIETVNKYGYNIKDQDQLKI